MVNISSLANVKFSILVTEYDSSKRIAFVDEIVVLENVVGHFQDMFHNIEGMTMGVKEWDRAARYKLVVEVTPQIDEVLKSGCIVRITHTKHPTFKTWRVVEPAEQYIARYVSNAEAHSNYRVVALVEKSDVPV